MNRNKVVLLLTLFALLSTAVAASALQNGGFVPAPINPDFLKYLDDLSSGKAANIIPPRAYISSQQNTRSKKNLARSASLEPSFDLVEKKWVTDIKDQRSWGTCWDFATMEAMESNLLKETGMEYELSELHLGFFAYYDETDDGNKPGFDVVVPPDENQIFDNGGTHDRPRAILSRGTGPVLDKDAPYPTVDASDKEFWKNYPSDPKALRSELLKAPVAFRLKESLIYHASEDIKQALKDHGGLWIAFNSSSIRSLSDPYIHTSQNPTLNHAVMLVGWDDELSRDHFSGKNSDSSPDIDGGWKIQNSWGKSSDRNGEEVEIGDGGYYWISYDDVSVFGSLGACSFVAMSADSYTHTYSHDPLGACYALEAPSNTSQTANVFTSERDEDLVYVGFDTNGHDIGYSIQIYKNIPTGGLPHEGEAFLTSPLTGIADFPGYRTVELAKPVPLYKGERFAVVVTLNSDDGLQIPVEARYPSLSMKATAGEGESYVRTGDNDEWEEVRAFPPLSYTDYNGKTGTIDYTNLTIKAFTNSVKRDSSSGSSGCATGAFALILIAVVPFVLRRHKRGS